MNKKKAFYALGIVVFFGAATLLFAAAADEQSSLSSGSPSAERVRLGDLAKRTPVNKHIELADFYFGKNYVYTTKLVQFTEVYLPVFPAGQPEDASNLRFLIQIRNDPNSNQPMIQTPPELDRFVADFNRHPTSISGMLRKPIDRVRSLTVEAYPGTNRESLQILWARHFPEQSSINVWWGLCVLCLMAAAASGIAFRRQRRSQPNEMRASPQTLSS